MSGQISSEWKTKNWLAFLARRHKPAFLTRITGAGVDSPPPDEPSVDLCIQERFCERAGWQYVSLTEYVVMDAEIKSGLSHLGKMRVNSSYQSSRSISPPATLVNASAIASGDGMIFMKLFDPIILRSGKFIAILKRPCSASTSPPLTRIS